MRSFPLPLVVLMLASPMVVSAADAPPPTPAPATATATAAAPASAPKAVTVDALVANPKAYAGTVAITGVVARVFPKTGSFVLIDSQEYAACNSVTCAQATLPIQTPTESFTGDLPQVKDTVVVTGEVTALDKGLQLTVTSVKQGDKVLRQRK